MQATNKRERTCIACGCKASKQTLLRLVRDKEGHVHFDATGNMPGRGAYVCSSECLEVAKEGKLQRSLRCKVDKEELAAVAALIDEAQKSALAR